MTTLKRRLLIAIVVLGLVFLPIVHRPFFEVFEDGSVMLFDTPGLGFCLPGGLCNRGG